MIHLNYLIDLHEDKYETSIKNRALNTKVFRMLIQSPSKSENCFPLHSYPGKIQWNKLTVKTMKKAINSLHLVPWRCFYWLRKEYILSVCLTSWIIKKKFTEHWNVPKIGWGSWKESNICLMVQWHNAVTASATEGHFSFVSRNLCSICNSEVVGWMCSWNFSLGGSLSLKCERILSASSDFNKKLAQGGTRSGHSF